MEGIHGRLGVECDGDYWHGPEQYDQDLHRERILMRSGLAFVHIRESAFRRDPEDSLRTLWRTLNRYRIFPESGKTPPTDDDHQDESGGGNIQAISGRAKEIEIRADSPAASSSSIVTTQPENLGDQDNDERESSPSSQTPSPTALSVTEIIPYQQWAEKPHGF